MPHGEPLVVSFAGTLNVERQDEVRATLMSTYEVRDVVIDLSGVDSMDSSALSALLVKRRIRKEQGFSPARLVGLAPGVQRVFALASLDRVWPIFATIAEAMASFPSRGEHRG